LKKTAFLLGLFLCLTMGIFTTKATLLNAQNPVPVVANNDAKVTDKQIVIDIVTINDFHGSLIKNGKNVGVANLVSAIKAQKAANPNTIFVAAGDLFQGSAESNLLYGQPVAACLKEAGLVTSAIGNHEYDWGNNRFASWEKEGGFSFLAANIYDRNTKKLVTYAKPYLIVNVSGIKIALIGLTTPETAYKTTPANVETVEFKNPVTVLPQYIKEARSQGANLVIALTHLGAFQDKSGVISGEAAELAQVAGLDGIIAGHTHEIIAGKVGSIPLVMAYYNGRSLGKLTFTIEKSSSKLISAQASLDHLYLHQNTLHEDEATKTILNKFLAQVQPILSETIGESKVDINHDVKKGPTLMGEWVCQVIQQKTQTQIAFYNGGGLRESLPKGKLTVGNLYTLLPFDNTLVTAKLTGVQVKETIENGLANPSLNYFGQTAGLYVVYDLTKPFGQRVVKITLANGVPLQMTKYYTVVANDFMFSGGDQYTMLTKAKDIKDTGIPIRDVLIDYIKAQKVIEPVYKGYQAPATESATVKPAA
jgi:2',3'-cyclic-nucleotide 2'-phosphodiesterase/3'-nucleotidase/5'-nucleotidase